MLKDEELTYMSIIETVMEIRSHDPGIGAYKLFIMLKDIYPDKKMIGRTRFYGLLHKRHLMLLPERHKHTTNSNHRYHRYKNLIKGFVPTAPNQLWVADITYINTLDKACYLHHITDAFTHKIIGWVLSDTLCAVNTIKALDLAIEHSGCTDFSKLIHHSDRGVQYCCDAYVARLVSIHAKISMTETYKPTDNAIAERVNGIIKQEWLYRVKTPLDIEDARVKINNFIEFYNKRRPHMSNGMLTPEQMMIKSLEDSSLGVLHPQPGG